MPNQWIQITGFALAASATGLACKHFGGQSAQKSGPQVQALEASQLSLADPYTRDILTCSEALQQVPDLVKAQKQQRAPLALRVQSTWVSDEVYGLKQALRQEGCQVELSLSEVYPKFYQDFPQWQLVLRSCQ